MLSAVLVAVVLVGFIPGERIVRPNARGLVMAVGAGLAIGAFILLALRTGDLAVVSALTALYPAGTILLAAIALRERVAVVQWVGLGLALAAGGMLAVA